MMNILQKAYAKINLTLDILGTRGDGFHEVKTLMHKISLCDDIELMLNKSGEIRLVTDKFICKNEENLAFRAAIEYLRRYNEKNKTSIGADISLFKRIPQGAGLGGGSADCASVLDGMNMLLNGFSDDEIHCIAASLGSDVPFSLSKYKFALAYGRGTDIEPLASLKTNTKILIVKPLVSANTGEIYRRFDEVGIKFKASTQNFLKRLKDVPSCFSLCKNDLEAAAFGLYPQIERIVSILQSRLPLSCHMTGSGSAVYAIFENDAALTNAKTVLIREMNEEISEIFAEDFL